MKVTVTGGSGFVGSAVLRRLIAEGHETVASVRHAPAGRVPRTSYVEGADLLDGTWSDALRGADAVIHTAARVHVMKESGADPLAEFRRANVEGTLRLASSAAEAGVRRFIFLSSIKANGEATEPGQPFRAADAPRPSAPYGISKMEAEAALFDLSRRTGLEVTVVRPPLVYGSGVKANFRTMMELLTRRVPLPLGAAKARRSLVALDNLVDLLVRCLDHPAAAGQVLLVSDGEDLSVADMLRRLGRALGRPALLLPIPPALIGLAARVAGQPQIAERLLKPLQVDIEPTHTALGWSPPVGVDDAFVQAARAFLEERRG